MHGEKYTFKNIKMCKDNLDLVEKIIVLVRSNETDDTK